MPRGRRKTTSWCWAAEKKKLQAAGYELVAGVDEAGCGALAGPVVAGAALVPLDARLQGLRDSKQLSPAQREEIYARILEGGFACSVGLAYVQEIDRLNIFHAARLAMRRAVEQLTPRPELLLMDGHLPPPFGIPCEAVVHGDDLCPLISVASVIAKVYRDRLMEQLALLYPHYGLEAHKGYATRQHAWALRQYGPSPIHRRGFAPVRAAEQLALPFRADQAGLIPPAKETV